MALQKDLKVVVTASKLFTFITSKSISLLFLFFAEFRFFNLFFIYPFSVPGHNKVSCTKLREDEARRRAEEEEMREEEEVWQEYEEEEEDVWQEQEEEVKKKKKEEENYE